MPMAEAAAHTGYLAEIIGVAVAGFGSIIATGAIGFAKLSARFDAHSKHNTEAHKRIEDAVEKLNGTGRDNTGAIIKIKTKCEERHPR
jgi:hypothetical protein